MSKRKKRRYRRTRKNTQKKIFSFLIVIIISALLLTPFITKLIEENTHPFEYSDYVEKYSKEYNVPENLLYATIKVESSFNPNAVSNVGALGLTQIMPETFDWLLSKTGESYTAEDLKKPEISIKYCAFFYSIIFQKFSDTKAAIAAYHAGMNQVSTWLEDDRYSSDGKTLSKIPSKATAHYVSKVTNAINVYNNLNKEENQK